MTDSIELPNQSVQGTSGEPRRLGWCADAHARRFSRRHYSVPDLGRSATSNPMSRLLCIFAPILLAVGCAPTPSASASKSTSIVGTWRWIRVDQQPVKEQFYVRYCSNGTAATWPAPEGWSTTNGVSYGRYHLEGEFLVLETGEDKDNPKAHIQIKGDEMVMFNDESNRLVYHRVVPDLEAGKLQSVKPK
jgi:hypothetical protein